MKPGQEIKSWQRGINHLDAIQNDLQKLQRIIQLIKQAEDRYKNLIAYAQGHIGQTFPSERSKAFRQAASTMAAHDRLTKYFNYTLMELSL